VTQRLDFSWAEDWGELPEPRAPSNYWAHPGVAVTADDTVVMVNPGRPQILLASRDGRLLAAWEGEFAEAHGLAVVGNESEQHLWIADPGFKILVTEGKHHVEGDGGGVYEYTLDGRLLRTIREPPIPFHTIHSAPYKPTSVAVFEGRIGGNDDVWIADGYGTSLVHRYSRDGRYSSSISGEEGRAGAFRNPHALVIDARHSDPELLIADRHNSRIQAYDLDGHFKRSFGSGVVLTPSAFAIHAGRLYVAELHGRIATFDDRDRLEGYLGDSDELPRRPGWPNAQDAGGRLIRPAFVPQQFNSPHGIATDSAGTLYVAEWVIGGRILRLQESTNQPG
jgi:hypothetical protein